MYSHCGEQTYLMHSWARIQRTTWACKPGPVWKKKYLACFNLTILQSFRFIGATGAGAKKNQLTKAHKLEFSCKCQLPSPHLCPWLSWNCLRDAGAELIWVSPYPQKSNWLFTLARLKTSFSPQSSSGSLIPRAAIWPQSLALQPLRAHLRRAAALCTQPCLPSLTGASLACSTWDNDSLQLAWADAQVKALEVGHVCNDSCLTLVLKFTATTIKLRGSTSETVLTTFQLSWSAAAHLARCACTPNQTT